MTSYPITAILNVSQHVCEFIKIIKTDLSSIILELSTLRNLLPIQFPFVCHARLCHSIILYLAANIVTRSERTCTFCGLFLFSICGSSQVERF